MVNLNLLSDLSFDEWIRFVFDHPITDPQWYWLEGCDFWNPNLQPALTISYLISTFNKPISCLTAFTDAQINQGLWYLVSNSLSDHMFALKDNRVLLPARLECIRSMFNLFEELFLPRCSPNLQYLDEKDTAIPNPLDSICYMWWDLLPIHSSTAGPDPEPTVDTILDVMTRTLALNSYACRESALHGLGHWYYYDPQRIAHIVSEFLQSYPHIRPELLTYARRAGRGHVQ